MHYFESAKIFDCLVVLAMREKKKTAPYQPNSGYIWTYPCNSTRIVKASE